MYMQNYGTHRRPAPEAANRVETDHDQSPPYRGKSMLQATTYIHAEWLIVELDSCQRQPAPETFDVLS